MKPWSDFPKSSDISLPKGATIGNSPAFLVNSVLNEKIFILKGSLNDVDADSIVLFTNEQYISTEGLTPSVLRQGGIELQESLSVLEPLKVGQVRAVRARGLSVKYLIFTSGPWFKEAFETAGDNSLNTCLREAVHIAIEHKCTSIVFPCIYSRARHFPERRCANVTARTARRILEKLAESGSESKIEKIIFYATTEAELEMYTYTILPTFFPRSDEECLLSLPRPGFEPGTPEGETPTALFSHKLISLGPGRSASDIDSDEEIDFMTHKNNRTQESYDKISSHPHSTRSYNDVSSNKPISATQNTQNTFIKTANSQIIDVEADISFTKAISGVTRGELSAGVEVEKAEASKLKAERQAAADFFGVETSNPEDLGVVGAWIASMDDVASAAHDAAEDAKAMQMYLSMVQEASNVSASPQIADLIRKISDYGFIRVINADSVGAGSSARRVVVFSPARAPPDHLRQTREFQLFVVRTLRDATQDKWLAVIVNSGDATSNSNLPAWDSMRMFIKFFQIAWEITLVGSIILHPSAISRAAVGLAYPFLSQNTWSNLKYARRISDLADVYPALLRTSPSDENLTIIDDEILSLLLPEEAIAYERDVLVPKDNIPSAMSKMKRAFQSTDNTEASNLAAEAVKDAASAAGETVLSVGNAAWTSAQLIGEAVSSRFNKWW